MGTAIQTMGGSSFRLVGVYKMSKAAVRHYRDTFFIHNITDDIQIMTGFRQNHRTGHLFVSKHAPNKRMGKMPVSHIFCQLKIKNVSNGSIFHQFFYFFKKRSVTQHMAHCKNKVFPFRSLHHFDAFVFTGRNRLFDQDVVAAFNCLHCRFIMQVVCGCVHNRIRKFGLLKHFFPAMVQACFRNPIAVRHLVKPFCVWVGQACNLYSVFGKIFCIYIAASACA